MSPTHRDQGSLPTAQLSTTKASSSKTRADHVYLGGRSHRASGQEAHAALLSCRWVAVPCPSWGVAYAEAMGEARQTIVAAVPTWLAFSDAWGGEVEAFWREAVESRDVPIC